MKDTDRDAGQRAAEQAAGKVAGKAAGHTESGPRRDLEMLTHGSIELLGQLVHSSNETFLVELTHVTELLDVQRGDSRWAQSRPEQPRPEQPRPEQSRPEESRNTCWAIYKPELGERPLHDFPPGLYRRERAAYLLAEALGWGIVPPTVIREDGPFGIGSLQLYVEHDPTRHYFTVLAEDPTSHDDLRRLALFDLVANNTDRKSGHVLQGTDGRLWGIDHGLCFAATFKVRTVIWDFAGERIDADLLADVAPLADEVPTEVAEQLTWFEVEALQRRVRDLLDLREFPDDPTGMRFPWPMV